MDLTNINVKQIRLSIVIGIGLLSAFMVADLALLPKPLHHAYLNYRISLQLPICILFLMSTCLPSFKKNYQYLLFITMTSIIYLNFALILTCWELMMFSFPYEGTIIYSLFSFFIFRLNFKLGLPFSIIIIVGFIVLLINYPIYGDKNLVNISFVVIGLIVALLGVYRLEIASNENDIKTQQLLYLSRTDPLTGVLNRAAFETRFNEKLILNKRSKALVCIYFIDLDYFKDYNDGYGHPEGDKVIQLQANMLKEIFQRSTDIVARFGGEEFIVVTSNIDEEMSKNLADKIIQKWEEQQQPHNKGKANEFVSCSVGYHLEKVNLNSSMKKLITHADNALYQAKENGRNRVVKL